MAKTLTARSVEQMKPSSKRLEVADGLLRCLYLVVQPSGKKSWAVRYRLGSRTRKLTMGPYPRISLEQAREDARAALRAAAKGSDPATAKKTARKADRDLFETVKDDFIDRYEKQRRDWRETERLLDKNVIPYWRGKKVHDITRRDIHDLLAKLRARGMGAGANRVFAAIRKLFNWAVAEAIIPQSPCLGIKAPVKETSRDRVLSDTELRWLWKATEVMGYPFGPVTRLLTITGQRLSEVAEMSRSELDEAAALWTIPRDRAKNDQAHEVPLAPQALAIVKELPKIGTDGYLFTTTGETPVSGFSKAKRILDAHMLAAARQEAAERGEDPDKIVIAPWRIHDLRRTAASGMARLGIQLPVIEKVLNHQGGSFSGIVRVYQRHSYADEKRAALEAWAKFVERTAGEGTPDNVVQLRANES